MSRTPLEHALWDLGLLDGSRQAAIDSLCRGDTANLAGCHLVSVDPDAYRITTHSLADDTQRSIKLPRPDGSYAVGGLHGLPLVMLFDDELKKVGAYPVDEVPAVLLVDGRPCRYTKSFRSQAFLPYGSYAPAMHVPVQGSAYGPVDLMVAPAGDQALVLDRGIGNLYHVDLAQGAVRIRIKVRVAGLSGALSAAWLGNRLFVVDGAAEKLITYDLRDGAIAAGPMGLGSVSSVVASPDGQVLYLFGTRPTVRVLAIDAESFEPLWTTPLRGEPFNHLGDPLGHLAVSPNGRQVMAVTAFPDPEPGTPVISVLDTANGRTVHRLRLHAGRRPAAVAFGMANPFHADLPNVDEAIVQLGYMTETELVQLKEGLGHDEPAEAWAESTVDLSALADPSDWRDDEIGAAEYMELPVELEQVVADHLQRTFQAQTGIDIRLDDAAWVRVGETATFVRQQLETATGVQIDLPELVSGQALRVFIGLAQVAEWLAVLAEVDAALCEVLAEMEMIQGIEDVPELCPACSAPVFGSYVCPACSHPIISDAALESIVMSVKPRESLKSGTADPRLFLPPDHLLIPDPARQRVVELDRTGAIIWSLEPERMDPALQSLLQWPVDALRLANEHTLIVDRGGRRVFEVTPTGRPYWEWPASAGRLGEPVRVARNEWGETYIVDRQRHRIWRADANGQPMPGYGDDVAGIGPGQLCGPGDVQLLSDGHLLITDTGNHRVIEVADGQIVWQFGNQAGVVDGGAGTGGTGLNTPQRAQRLENGQTVILDSGNHRLVVAGPNGAVIQIYDTIVGDPGMDIARPLRMMRLPKGHLAYWDHQRLVEIDPAGKIAWAADLVNLDTNPRLQLPEPAGEATAAVWHVQALTKDDPERQAVEAEKARRREETRIARQAYAAGDNPAYVSQLKSMAKRRAGSSSTPRHWRIDLEVLKRLVAQNCILLMKKRDEVLVENGLPPVKAPNFKGNAPPAFRTRAKPETTDLGLTPVPLLAVQTASNRLVLLARNQKVLWNWGMTALREPNAAVLLPNRQVLVADTGNNRIVVVDIESADIIWQTAPALGLNAPRAASRLANGNVLIADTGNRRIVEVAADHRVVWQWQDDNVLQVPTSCERLDNGNTLITDRASHVVIEVNPAGTVVWTYGHLGSSSKSAGFLSHPEHASRRTSGHTLIVDGRNHRILDVDAGGTVAWSYSGEGPNRLSGPTYAMVHGGSVWIAHGGGRQLYEVSRTGAVLWRFSSGL
ncbi:MAG: PQQ-binding-like beta-propeller repeat protein [Candidatus Sericytochromatia bacterium]|nr:PQQ-binding-like beta-propeller repeat protein [Candidatus Sericytochromatia bacterium]